MQKEEIKGRNVRSDGERKGKATTTVLRTGNKKEGVKERNVRRGGEMKGN